VGEKIEKLPYRFNPMSPFLSKLNLHIIEFGIESS